MIANKFTDLKFGYADAHREAEEAPYLLTKGFYDPFGLADAVTDGSRFLVLGPKGSGKSAFAAHLELLASSAFMVRTIMLADFPFQDFSTIQAGGISKESRYPAAWKWIMCLALLSSFEVDEAAHFSDYRPFRDSLRALRDQGWLPDKSLRPLVLDNTRKSSVALKLPIANAAQESTYVTSGMPFPAAIETIGQLVLGFRSTTRHLLIIDGLDDLIIQSTLQWEILSALIVAAARLNGEISAADVNAKVVILCRSDIYNRLPGANTNKYRRDSAVTLNWYQDIKNPRSSNLIALANRKASAELEKPADIFGQFFPSRFRHQSGRWFDTVRYLLDYTRHTPRDLLQLLSYIKDVCPSDTDRRQVPGSVIEAGVHNFCAEYFVGELRNELDGLLTVEAIEATKRLLRALGRHRFYFHELERKVRASPQYASLPLQNVIDRLYDAGVVGNAVAGRDDDRIRFKYRNPHQELDYDAQIILHNGLVNAFNVPRALTGAV